MLVAFLKKSSAKNFLAFWDRVRSREVCAMGVFLKKLCKKLIGIRGKGMLTDYMRKYKIVVCSDLVLFPIHQYLKQHTVFFCHEMEDYSAHKEEDGNYKASDAYEKCWKSFYKTGFEIFYKNGHEEAYAEG